MRLGMERIVALIVIMRRLWTIKLLGERKLLKSGNMRTMVAVGKDSGFEGQVMAWHENDETSGF